MIGLFYIIKLQELIARGIIIYETKEELFNKYQEEAYICKVFIEGCKDETIKQAYHQEQMRLPQGEWYLDNLEETYKFMRTTSAYISNNLKKNIKVDSTNAMYNVNSNTNQEWVVYCRYCDKKGHKMEKCHIYKRDKDKNELNQEWLNKPKSERRCDHCCIKGHCGRI